MSYADQSPDPSQPTDPTPHPSDERSAERMVGVVVVLDPPCNPWAEPAWKPVAVLAWPPEAEPWTLLDPARELRYAGPAALTLHRHETGNYLHNLTEARPAVYVALRRSADPQARPLLLGASVDPGWAHAVADVGDDIVEATPMPPEIADWIAAFIARHPPPETRWKRKRERADPEALARRPPEEPS